MVIFQYNLYIFGIHLWTVLYPKPCFNEPFYKEVVVYYAFQYPLDFGADVIHDSCLTAASFRSIAAYFDQKPSTKTSN